MKKVVALLALALASVALVACGGSSDNSSSATTATSGGGETTSGATGGANKEESSGGGGSSTLKFEADPEGSLAYTTTEATAKAGKVTVEFNNPQGLPHDVAIEDSAGEEVGATKEISEGTDSTTVNLKPGTYHFFCTVPGHREAGMEGTLTVK
jgi:plastocyanin